MGSLSSFGKEVGLSVKIRKRKKIVVNKNLIRVKGLTVNSNPFKFEGSDSDLPFGVTSLSI
jgi:hypothetical protein